MKELIEEVFSQVLTFFFVHGYIKLENYFVDGTKLRADANKNSHLWAANTKRYKAGVNKRIKELLTEVDQLNEQEAILYADKHLEAYGEDSELPSEQVQEEAKALNKKINHLQAGQKNTAQQAGKVKSQARQIAKAGTKLAISEQQEKLLNRRNSYSKTDLAATFMRMRDGQLLPATTLSRAVKTSLLSITPSAKLQTSPISLSFISKSLPFLLNNGLKMSLEMQPMALKRTTPTSKSTDTGTNQNTQGYTLKRELSRKTIPFIETILPMLLIKIS